MRILEPRRHCLEVIDIFDDVDPSALQAGDESVGGQELVFRVMASVVDDEI
jgi:hypothetical protein